MFMPLFSIIIPAFNAEGHIRRLLDSIHAQSFSDYEIIVVCDSCHDNTETIAKEYGAVTDTVSFGCDGLTRDHGIKLASGKWILFADDDDWYLHAGCFTQIARCINQADDDVDVVAFGYISKEEGLILPCIDNLFMPTIDHVWSSCWKHSAIGNAKFGNATFCSDTYFMRDMRSQVRKCITLDMPLYFYNLGRTGSQTDLFRKGIIKASQCAY